MIRVPDAVRGGTSAGGPSPPAAVRRAVAADIPRIVEVEAAAFPNPWSGASFRSLLSRRDVVFLVAEVEGDVVGHAVLWWVGEEGELANLAVDPAHRDTGVGGTLLEAVLAEARGAGVTRVFLEVRASNQRARRLYRRRGFVRVGVRRGYYRNPTEDALLLRLDLTDENPDGASLSRGMAPGSPRHSSTDPTP